MRRICSRPWRNGSRANPGKIPTCIQVSVRPETTTTFETMLESCPQLFAGRTGLARIGRTHIRNGDPRRTRLVFHKALQLSECPTVESRAHAPARADAFADTRKIFQYNLGSSDTLGFLDYSFARFVVDMSDTPPLSTGDLPESLPRTLAAVGLETTTQGQKLIASMTQSFATPDPARAGGGKCIFPDIHAHDRTGYPRFAVARLDNEIEKPVAAAKHQFSLLRLTAPQDLTLVIPKDHLNEHAPTQCAERDSLALERIGAAVEMDARAIKTQRRNWCVAGDAAQGALCAIRLADREDGIARHLRSQRGLLAQVSVAEPVQGNPIPTALLPNNRYEAIAGIGVGIT